MRYMRVISFTKMVNITIIQLWIFNIFNIFFNLKYKYFIPETHSLNVGY